MIVLIRLFVTLWIFGLIVLALIGLSSFIYSTEPEPERTQRLQMRLRMAAMWPIAIWSSAGRARLRRG
jgi:hypothetical protein